MTLADDNTNQVAERTVDGADGGVAEGIVELLHDLVGDAAARKVLLGGVERRETELRAGAGHKHLVLGHVAGGGMVLGVGDPPCVVRNPKPARAEVAEAD